MSTLRLASRAVWCRSWAIFVGGIQKTRIRSVVGQVLQASLCKQGLVIHVERLPFIWDLTCSRIMDGGDAPCTWFGFSRCVIGIACKFMGLVLSILHTGLQMEEIK
jgi:hypothetical protein